MDINNGLPILRLASEPTAGTSALNAKSSGLRPLRLIQSNRRLWPHLERNLHEVNTALQQTLNDLAVGKLPWPLLVYGPAGTGKTCAVLALADVCEIAAIWDADDWATFVIRKGDELDAELSRLAAKELLIVDEIGCRSTVGDLHYTSLKKLIDLRDRSENRAAIFISNLEPKNLIDLFDDRIYSRLTRGTVFELDGADRRQVQA